MYKIGDEVDVYVMKVDPETKKIALSLRRAQPQAWDDIVDKYQVGRVVPGMVTKLVTFGAFARIEGPVEGLIHVSELVDRRIQHPKEVVREGDLLPLKIVRIERDRHRLGLSLREAREEGERMGFRFTDAGEVMEVPEDVRREFEEREGVAITQRSPEEIRAAAASSDAAAESSDEAPRATATEAREAPAPAAPVVREEEEEPSTAMAEAFKAAGGTLDGDIKDAVAEEAPTADEAPAAEDVSEPAASAEATADEASVDEAPAEAAAPAEEAEATE
jgi:predicted RNA-binding protein with RPS1 domain